MEGNEDYTSESNLQSRDSTTEQPLHVFHMIMYNSHPLELTFTDVIGEKHKSKQSHSLESYLLVWDITLPKQQLRL